MYTVFALKTARSRVGVAIAKGQKVARFFQVEADTYEYYEELGRVKYPWMIWAMFLDDYPDLYELDRHIKAGMSLKVFLMHDGSQDE